MGRKHALDGSLETITAFFDHSPVWSFSPAKLYEIIEKERYTWKVPLSRGIKYLIDYLLKRELLFTNSFVNSENKQKEIYSWRTKDDLTVMTGLRSSSYYCYYSAMFLNGLTLQIPKTFYLNAERSSGGGWDHRDEEMEQANIDAAFAGEQRKSGTIFTYYDKKVILTNSKNTGRMGVVENFNERSHYSYTDVERTLIDCSVRPSYSGGVTEVLEAYRLAMEQLDIEKLSAYLTELEYLYPYHQVIGFYLEKAGYDERSLSLFDQEKRFDFYLTYNMRKRSYSERWRLYYPSGL